MSVENIAWVLAVSMFGGTAVLAWFLFKPEKKCLHCRRPLNKYGPGQNDPGTFLYDCNSCNCQGEEIREPVKRDFEKK